MSLAVKRFNVVKNILNKSIFDENVIHMILKYYWKLLDNKRKVLLPWIDNEYLYCYGIYFNLNAIELLTNNQDKINWTTLCRNPNAIDLLENNPDNIDWAFLASNPNAINLLKNNNIDINYQYWNELSKNPAIFKAV